MSKPALVLIIGSVRRGEYETLLANGLRLGIILDDNRQASAPASGGFDWVAHYDFTRPLAGLDMLLESVCTEFCVVAVLNLREFYVRALAYVAQRLALPGLPEVVVERVLNKTLMRQRFVEALGPEIAPPFAMVACADDALAFAAAAGYPVVLKPNQLYGSLFVRVVDDDVTLARAFDEIQAQVSAHMRALGVVQSLPQNVQIEAYLSGSVHSVDCLIDARQRVYLTPVVDVITGREVGQAHFGHVVRRADSHLPRAAQQRMHQVAAQAVVALQMRSTAAHVEFIATTTGPRLLEIAARPGGHRNRVLEMTHGISFNWQYVRMLLGATPDLAAQGVKPFAIVTPYPSCETVFNGVQHLDQVQRMRSYLSHEIKVRPGSVIGPAQRGHMSSWLVELGHADREVLDADVRWMSGFDQFFQ
jgi:biotin carboxylase